MTSGKLYPSRDRGVPRAALAVCATVAVTLAAFACDDEEARPGETATPSAEAAATPTAEPASETLAFIRAGDVWLVNADGSDERQLGLTNVEAVSWISPAELDVSVGGEQPDHLMVDLEGNAEHLPSPAGGTWSKDGTVYVVADQEQIVVFDRGGQTGLLTVLPPPGEGPKPQQCGGMLPSGDLDRLLLSVPALAPDNQELVVAVNCQSRMAAVGNLLTPVVVVSLEGGVQQPLGHVQVNVGSASSGRYSPDGSHVALRDSFHISACAAAHGLQVVDLESGRATAISLDEIDAAFEDAAGFEQRGGVVGYDWSPESDAVVASFNVSVCRQVEAEPGIVVEPVVKGLYTVGLDGAAEKLVDGATHSPAWSSSGKYIAYVAQESFGEPGPPALRVLDRATGDVLDLGEAESPDWQPQDAEATASENSAQAAATAVAAAGGFDSSQDVIEGYVEEWLPPVWLSAVASRTRRPAPAPPRSQLSVRGQPGDAR